jgi:hypothetical protein
MRTFDHFVLRRRMRRVQLDLIADTDLVIEPAVHEQAIVGYSENLRPILHRRPLQGGETLTEPPVFGPIEVASA